jgi:hypothetical protein
MHSTRLLDGLLATNTQPLLKIVCHASLVAQRQIGRNKRVATASRLKLGNVGIYI